MNQFTTKFVKIGALWQKDETWSGVLELTPDGEKIYISIIKNKYKTGNKPDFIISKVIREDTPEEAPTEDTGGIDYEY
jgi:hypothetical protein